MVADTFYRLCVFVGLFLILGICAQKPSKCGSRTECGSCLQQLGCVWCVQPKSIDRISTFDNFGKKKKKFQMRIIPESLERFGPTNNVQTYPENFKSLALSVQTKNSPDRNSSKDLNHCIPRDSKEICSVEDVVDPTTGSRIVKDQPLRSKSGDIVQMKPQKIDLALRVGQTVDVKFQYSQAENYPVDLYYIIDNSHSMEQHKDKLSKLGTKLSETMANITNNFRIGFGSFIDKIELPFVSTVPYVFNNPCKGCTSPYDFKNHLPLTSDFPLFSQEVDKARLSGNIDAPEGGFDAIMQAIVCKKEIGWRPQARHFIMFSSDAEFHIAGDGKLVGAFETNDAKCHMRNQVYQGLQKDYPSISHLNYVLKENNVNIIFAIVKSKKNVLKSYRKLSENIDNSKTDGLDADSTNVVQLVVENYRKIVSAVTLEANSTDNIQVKLTPHCKNPIRNGCENVGLGEVVDFTASIKLLDCAENSSLPTFISIKPHAINESLVLKVTPICGCSCESPTHSSYRRNSKECEGNGDLVCGVCKCKDGNHGTSCECDRSSPRQFNDANCRENKTDFSTCSGRGSCICGKCECSINPNTGGKYRGKFCDCDDASCEVENGKLCNGKGNCDCGKCVCFDGWTGSSCGCPDKYDLCINGGDTEVCSGRGHCSCGRCNCPGKYSGTYCEICPHCVDECVKLRDCVECTVFRTGTYDRTQCQLKCFGYDIISSNGVVEKMDEEERMCRMIDQNKCEFVYKYVYDELKKVTITVQKEKYCEPNILVWVLAVMGLVLLIGFITLLIWKIATLLHDAREYAKFMNEQKNSKWHRGDNPLYKGATTTFHNPHYTQ